MPITTTQKKKPSEDPLTKATLGRLKADHMVTQRRDGSYHLRTYGRAALVTLLAIAMQEAEEMRDAAA